MSPLLFSVMAGCCYVVAFGLVRLVSWFIAQGNRRTLAAYRAEVLMAEARCEVFRRVLLGEGGNG